MDSFIGINTVTVVFNGEDVFRVLALLDSRQKCESRDDNQELSGYRISLGSHPVRYSGG